MKQSLTKTDLTVRYLEATRELYEKKEAEYEAYIDRLLEWNDKINLVSRTVSRETVREHVVHSLIPISINLLSDYDKWIDAGSGGGLPGIPISIAEKGLKIVLNDNIKKKMMAADDIISSLKLPNVSTIDKSISLVNLEKGTGIVSKHAFKVPKLLQLLDGKPWEKIVLWKGAKDAESELSKLKNNVKAHLYRFDFGDNKPFYEGKGLLVLYR